MRLPYFLEWRENEEECLDVITANTLQLLPFSNEKYTFFIPKNIIDDVIGGVLSIFGGWIVTPNGSIPINENSEINNLSDGLVFTINNLEYNSWDMVYFKLIVNVSLTEQKTIYSSKFRISSLDLDQTTYIQFKDRLFGSLIGGVRLNMWYWHQIAKNEITTYYQVTKERTISVGSKRDRLDRYYVETTGIGQANALIDVLTYEQVYFNGVRTFAYELPEIENLTADENFVSFDVLVTKDYNDVLEQESGINIYVLGNHSEDEIIGDGNNNIINTNITTDGN